MSEKELFKRFMYTFGVLLLGMIVCMGLAEVVITLVCWLPIEGDVGVVIKVAIGMVAYVCSTFPLMEALDRAFSVVEAGCWKRFGKYLKEMSMSKWKWILLTFLVSSFVNILLMEVVLAYAMYNKVTYKSGYGALLGVMIMEVDISLARMVQRKAVKKKSTNEPQT